MQPARVPHRHPGSQAAGRAEPESDHDLLCVREAGGTGRDVRAWRGLAIDAFVHDEASLEGALEPGFIRLRGGRVLRQREDVGTRLLRRVEELAARGPPALPAEEVSVLRVWAAKMLVRIARGDGVGHYRRVSLLTELLPFYFSTRRRWFLGPKESLAWLRAHDPRAHEAFEEALQPEASLEALARLVEIVLETRSESSSAAVPFGLAVELGEGEVEQ